MNATEVIVAVERLLERGSVPPRHGKTVVVKASDITRHPDGSWLADYRQDRST
jgi:hypothetical protein